MDYSEVNKRHLPFLKGFAVRDGKARFLLIDGSVIDADTPEEAESKVEFAIRRFISDGR